MLKRTLLFSICLISSPSFAKIYKWVDDNGKTHYGDKPFSINQAKLTTKDVNLFLTDFEKAVKSKNWKKIQPFFLTSAKIQFDNPQQKNTVLTLNVTQFQVAMESVWKTEINVKETVESTDIKISKTGDAAKITQLSTSIASQFGIDLVETKDKQIIKIKSYSSAPKISYMYSKTLNTKTLMKK